MSDHDINKVLVIDQSKKFQRVLVRFFSEHYPNTEIKVYDLKKGCPDSTFPWHKFDLLFLNFKVGEKSNGLDWLKICRTDDEFPATIITADCGHEKIAVGTFRYGAQDYLSKESLTISKLQRSITRAMNKYVGENSKDDEQLLQSKLVNRVKLYQRLNDTHENGALLLVTIDKFNEIHNTIGLIAADKLTTHLAEGIVEFTASINSGNIEIIRINDDTIAAIIVEAENDKFYVKFAEKICNYVASSKFEYGNKSIDYKISIGITRIKDNSHGQKPILPVLMPLFGRV